MKNKKGIRRNIFLNSAIIISLAFLIILTGIYGFVRTGEFTRMVFPLNNQISELVKASNHFESFQANLDEYLLIGAERNRIQFEHDFAETRIILSESSYIETVQPLIDEILEEMDGLYANLQALERGFQYGMSSRERNQLIIDIYANSKSIQGKIKESLEKISSILQLEIRNQSDRDEMIILIYLILAIVILCLYIFLGLRLSNDISKPILKLKKVTGEILKGNLDIQISVNSKNEIGELASVFNEMTLMLSSTLSELRESEEKYRTLFERDKDAIILFEPESGIIIDTNHAAGKIYGYEKEELINLPFYDLLPKGSKIPGIDYGGEKNEGQLYYHHKKKNGELFPAEVNAYRISLGNKKVIFVVSRDVTEKIRIEERLIQSEKMMTVGGLAAGMAHEINNPLNNIFILADIIKSRLGLDENIKSNDSSDYEKNDLNEDTLKRFLEENDIGEMVDDVIESGKRIDDIIKSMLDFSKKRVDKKDFHNIVNLMERTIKLFITEKKFKKAVIHKEYQEDLPDIFCNSGKLQQVFLNILSNGIHAMEDATISKPEFFIRIHRIRNGTWISIEIEDTGQGMREDVKRRIFEPFFTTKKTGKGTGLGLSISYFIITENHKGEMLVESSEGKGANFIIRLPINMKEMNSPDEYD